MVLKNSRPLPRFLYDPGFLLTVIQIEGLKNTPIIKQNQLIRGHEFHYWEIENNLSEIDLRKGEHQKKLSSPWKIKSWETEYKSEGFFDEKLHASWIHLHLPSSPEVANIFLDATQN